MMSMGLVKLSAMALLLNLHEANGVRDAQLPHMIVSQAVCHVTHVSAPPSFPPMSWACETALPLLHAYSCPPRPPSPQTVFQDDAVLLSLPPDFDSAMTLGPALHVAQLNGTKDAAKLLSSQRQRRQLQSEPEPRRAAPHACTHACTASSTILV